MKILGICGSNRKTDISGTYALVERVLEATGIEYELVTFYGKRIIGCTACLGCAGDNVCKVKDDMTPIRDLLVEADAYVIGSPNYYSGINGVTHSFLERFFQFRHQEGDTLWGKLAVAVGVGGVSGDDVNSDIEKFMLYNCIKTIAKVSGQGAASCFSCGFGETCAVGIPRMLFGEGVKITKDMIPDVMKQIEVLKQADEAGKLLGEQLKSGYDKLAVAQEMQKILSSKFSESA